MTTRWMLILCCSLLAAPACVDELGALDDRDREPAPGEPALGEPALGEIDQAIEIATNDVSTAARNAVVLVGGFCTGTLIAPNIVLTAAHCGFDNTAYATGTWHTIAPVTIYFGPSRSAPVATATANAVSLPPIATAGPWPIDDMALLRLTTNVPATTAIPRPTYVDRPATLSSSSTIVQVGYGGGRNRRFATGTEYRDWLSPTHSYLMNGFAYTSAHRGPGIGDRDENIEGGDSGGPMLLGSIDGFVLGELSHWEPYGIATFGPGGEGRPAVREWVAANAPQQSDWGILSIVANGCTGTGGQPTVGVVVKNAGARTSSAWIDVFHGLPSAPAIGTLSAIYRGSNPHAPEASRSYSFAIPAPPGGRWIDVIVDTTQSDPELSETNNIASAYVVLPDCSFN